MKFAPLRKFADGGMTSVVDYAKASGRGSSFKDRKQLADSLGIKGYSGSGQQNLALLAKMQDMDKASSSKPDFQDVGDKGEPISFKQGESSSRLDDIRKSYDSIQNTKQAQQPVIRRNVETKPSTPQTTAFTPLSQRTMPDSTVAKQVSSTAQPAPVISKSKPTSSPIPELSGFDKLRAASGNLGIPNQPQQSIDKNGNIQFNDGVKLSPFQVMQNKLDAGAYSYDNVGTGNVLQRLGNFTKNIFLEPALQAETSAGKILTGDGEKRDAVLAALALVGHGAARIPGNLKNVIASGASSEAAMDALMAAKRTAPKMIAKTAKVVGAGIKDAAGNVISQREGMSPALRNIAGNLDKAEIPFMNQNMANIVSNQALQQGEQKLASQGLRNMMSGTAKKAASNKKVESRLNDLYERSTFKTGGININPANRGKFNATKARTGESTEQLTHSVNPLTRKRAIFAQNASHWKKEDGGYINEEDQYKSPSQFMEYMKSGGMKKGMKKR